jgi:hypothetical protein
VAIDGRPVDNRSTLDAFPRVLMRLDLRGS